MGRLSYVITTEAGSSIGQEFSLWKAELEAQVWVEKNKKKALVYREGREGRLTLVREVVPVPVKKVRRECPDCGSTNIGSEQPGENYCYSCGFQWMKRGHRMS